MEIRLHSRGGQGGVTCAKILAALYAELGKSVQSFGDYAGERSGAPVRAYTRVADQPITNRNKVYRPDEVLVLDSTLLGDDAVAGLAPGGLLLIDSPEPPAAFAGRYGRFRVATVDATAIARQHGIGTQSVVIVNTTIAGAYVRIVGLPLETLEATYDHLGFRSNFAAARQAYEAVKIDGQPSTLDSRSLAIDGRTPAKSIPILDLTEHVHSPPTGLRTGDWRTQMPKYVDHLAPCNAFCPAGNDVVGFVQAVAKRGAEAAARILGRSTPFAATCGRVCPAPCQEGCNRRELDGAVRIRGLERWIADRAPVASPALALRADAKRIAIIGGGPAGLSAAYTLVRAGHAVTLFEREARLGGILATGIPDYRLPPEVVEREVRAIVELGVSVRCGQVMTRDKLAALHKDFDAVIVATGLQRLRRLSVLGADLAGIEQGIDYLRRVNLEHKGRLGGHVVVLGGGNTAMDCARSALRSGAAEVTVAYRRTREDMPAISEEVDEARHEGIRFLFQRQPMSFAGGQHVAEVELAEVEPGEPDASGRCEPVVTSRTARLGCDHVLLALGQSPDLSLLPEGWQLDGGQCRDGKGPLNVFAAGDLGTGDGTVAHAIGDGRRAAGRALRFIGLEVEVFERPDRAQAVPVTDLRLDHFARRPPTVERARDVRARIKDFAEVNQGLLDGLEAHRCFSCGHCTQCDTCLVYCPDGVIARQGAGYAVDYAFCKGCGICAAECPRQGLDMVPTCQPS